MANSLDDLFEEAPDVLQYFLSLPPDMQDAISLRSEENLYSGRFTTVRGTLTKRIIKRKLLRSIPWSFPFFKDNSRQCLL